MPFAKARAPRNRTLTLSATELALYRQRLHQLQGPVETPPLQDMTICQDVFTALPWLPPGSVDLLVLDPPYNRHKIYHQAVFTQKSAAAYGDWFRRWLELLLPLLKPTASVYVCADWQSSIVVQPLLADHFQIRNRITWEREKGRGARRNWKNSSEDIWFCTVSDDYVFNVDAVKQKRRVLAPYRRQNGAPKDWQQTQEGRFRLTHPSNLWTDISVPFWSMPENTDHPTQKPEKLIAKLVLASSQPGQLVLDPFLGSGTTAVVAKKLGRHYLGIEIEEMYCCLAEKRLARAAVNPAIQGYVGGCFWDRNTLALQREDRQGGQSNPQRSPAPQCETGRS